MTARFGSDLLSERFWGKVYPEPNTGCWLWGASADTMGYGTFRVGRKTTKAHRLSFTSLVGPIPEGLQLDHLCRVPQCVNPDHLEPVTARENVRRGANPAAVNARKIECNYGHPFTDGNTRFDPDGKRNCKTCDTRRTREYLERKKAWE